jgi:mono/diheme cytochrome c family protein
MSTFLVPMFALFILAAQGGTAAAQAVGDPVNGEAVFRFGNTSCSNCHGNGAVGGWGPDLAGKGITVAQATRAIRQPLWRMPSFALSQLTNQEIVDMVAYWDSLPPAPEIGAWREPAPVNPPRGQQLAVTIIGCGQCHGATLTTPRHGAAEVGADFEWFKHMVYNHSTAMPEKFDLREANQDGPPRPRRRVRMGNYTPRRLPEAELREIWDWMTDIGLLVPVSARLAGGPAAAAGTTYTLDVANNALPQVGMTAEDVTVSLIVPAGTQVVSATGTGYQGVQRNGQAEVAVWRVPDLEPKASQQFTITLSGTPAGDAVPRGTVGWARPVATSDALVNFALPRPGGRGRGAGE